MSVFTMQLHSATQSDIVEGVQSFVGEDESGQFGLMPFHEPVITVLKYSVAKYRKADMDWSYVALPGAVLHFENNVLYLAARNYILGANFSEMRKALNEVVLKEEQHLTGVKDVLIRLEQQMMRQLWQMEQR